VSYQWYSGASSVAATTTISNATATTYAPSSLTTTTYYRVVASFTGSGCDAATSNVIAKTVYPQFTAGAIATASGSATPGTNPNITIANATAASGGYGTISYQWRRSGTSSATLSYNAATYPVGNDASNYAAVGTYYINRYAKDETCNTEWTKSTGTYTLTVTGVNQQQGSCTFTQPAALTTFQTFDKNYSGATYVTLTDSRDNKNYTVVKIGTRWVMAQNLNYQTGLNHQTNSASPSTATGQNTDLIGNFWCPGGNTASTPTSTLASCDVWGALYSWETAMSLDGKGAWSENLIGNYCTGAASTTNCNQNWGRTAAGTGSGGRGICPENWHVPTDYEWGVILDGMESGGGSVHQSTNSSGQHGTNAGSRAKSSCTAPSGTISGDTYVSDTQANWYYHDTYSGTDNYGFRVLPAGCRNFNGSNFNNQGRTAYFWSSSANNSMLVKYRYFNYTLATVYRGNITRTYGYSVRCVRDE
jgi:uncharacterized protein (TIGR02145 family)